LKGIFKITVYIFFFLGSECSEIDKPYVWFPARHCMLSIPTKLSVETLLLPQNFRTAKSTEIECAVANRVCVSHSCTVAKKTKRSENVAIIHQGISKRILSA